MCNTHSPVIEVVYLTTRRKGFLPTHVKIASMPKPSTALCEQITSVSKECVGRWCAKVTDKEMRDIDSAMMVSLGIQQNKGGFQMFKKDGFNAADIIQFMLKSRGRTQKSLAEELGIGAQMYSKKLSTGTLSASEFFASVSALGLAVAFSDVETGEDVRGRVRGIMPRTAKVIDGVRYDTNKAESLCHVEIMEGYAAELYKDAHGRFFLVIGAIHDGRAATIPFDETTARRFYETHMDDSGDDPEAVFGRKSLTLDPSYQRTLDVGRVKKMIRDFDAGKVNIVEMLPGKHKEG
jgi:transcriptional regulator with XRE-family HTH domain